MNNPISAAGTALADSVEDMAAEDIKALLIYAAETLERQHEYL